MSAIQTGLYVLSIAAALAAIVAANRAMNKNRKLCMDDKFSAPFIATAGFLLFPGINLLCTVWLIVQLIKASTR